MDWMSLLNQVKDAIYRDPTTPQQPGHDPSGLIGQIEGLFGQHAQAQPQNQQVLPASQDPYGDPALQGSSYGYLEGQNVRPASEDPLGDPGAYGTPAITTGNSAPAVDTRRFGNVRPASEDPLGDPADQS